MMVLWEEHKLLLLSHAPLVLRIAATVKILLGHAFITYALLETRSRFRSEVGCTPASCTQRSAFATLPALQHLSSESLLANIRYAFSYAPA
ncbi:hypothetical protein L207DRAFT_137048 [Hyaloscypha variabilis F]|uniref:Uncharacterized protein n=1 Tax=Hyaloscypha variabilis (strain UAMH 11265 / GT02V1 / F) TaxID=1149755 RepID=A0A2J6R6M7_HYAVF|nr:hypothetical protein L207DRAFT_137048 [Hyaloscypha variabilis F]